MADRIKLAALLCVALVALAALTLVVYNFVANDWTLGANPLDTDLLFDGEDRPVEADDRTSTAVYHYGDSIRSVTVATQALRVEVKRARSSELDVFLTLNGDAVDSSRYRTSIATSGDGALVISSSAVGALGNASGTLLLHLPSHISLSISSDDGDVSVHGADTALRVTTSSGGISIAGARGRVRCESERGAIALEACSGDSLIVTSGGAVELSLTDGALRVHAQTLTSRQHFGSLDATVIGDVEVDVLSTSSPLRLVSARGNVRLRVLDGALFAFDIAAPNGDIVASLPLDTLGGSAPGRTLRATMNGGSVPAYIRAGGVVVILPFKAGQTSTIEYDGISSGRRRSLAARTVQ